VISSAPELATTPSPLALAAEQGASALPEQANALARARSFAQPLIEHELLDTGENILAHADAVADILRGMGGSEAMQAAAYLVYACDHLNKPQEVIAKAFGEGFAQLAVQTTKLMQVQRQARIAEHQGSKDGQLAQSAAQRTETVRKMLLAFSKDLRVVMLRLASRMQTLRHYAAIKQSAPFDLAHESLHVFAPLANRLGIWQLKWEMEDLAFRFLEPDTYKSVAQWLDAKRTEREADMLRLRERVTQALKEQGIAADVQGRPKHIYSIVKKMRGKNLPLERVFDVRAMRVIVAHEKDCFTVLAWAHAQFTPVAGEFDDYISKPKANGYQSLHTVVRDETGQPVEIQIRTRAMHEHAEHGVAAHWAYKEAGTKGYAGVSANSAYDAKIAVLRQLLAWERDLSADESARLDDRIYVLTPDAAVIELPFGATAIDFAYTVHTSLGHRCRGAKADGVMIPLQTRLKNGQTIEITTTKEGGPSRDWLNPELGYLVSHRAKAKVRAWFNAQATSQTVARGRELVEKLLQREGKTAIKHDTLAEQLGFANADDLFEVVGKDELSLKSIEAVLQPAPEPLPVDDYLLLRKQRHDHKPSQPKGGVLVVGVDSLLTQLAKCCKPAPPDAIHGFVTRGKGVSIHREDCTNFRHMAHKTPERVIDVAWGKPKVGEDVRYPVDLAIEASDRQALLRDITEVFSREKLNVIGVQTHSVRDHTGGTAHMVFTVEVSDSGKLGSVLAQVRGVAGVRSVRRK
jgi:GTP pyrophosphokinase